MKRDKAINIFWSVLLTLLLLPTAIYLGSIVKASAVQSTVVCPPNSTPLANGLCKDEPTGCPYGDSIPLDSPKCVAPNDIPVQVETSEPAKVSKCE